MPATAGKHLRLEEQRTALPAGAKSYRILIVEDEGLIAQDILGRLEGLGHTVVDTVATAEAAVEMAPQADVILMDIRIDGPRDGIDAAREIRQKHHLPVIFLTPNMDRSTLDRAMLTGPFGYLIKPVATTTLQAAIEVAVSRHKVERNLEEQEAWLRATLASAADATMITAPDSSIRFLNLAAERITGWTNEEARGLPCAKVLPLVAARSRDGEQTLEPVDPVELALLRDEPFEFDACWRLLDRSGRELVVEGSVAPVRDEHAVFGAVVTFRDVTARRRQEQQFQQAQRMDAATRLAAGVAEEYSNPVAIIRAQAEHLLAQLGEYSPVRRAIEDIRQAASSATQISRRLSAFRSRPSVHLESFTVNSLLRRMSKLIQSAAANRIKVSTQIGSASGRVHANSNQIEQAILNLVMHACASMPGGGELALETTQEESWVKLAVIYSGVEANLEHIFEPVASPDQSLALPVAHAIVRDHDGYLTARAAPGGGTRLELLLPRAPESPLPEVAATSSILLVEGREGIRTQLHKFFESRGYNLLEASDAREAATLGQMYAGRLDLVIAEEREAEELATALRPVHASLAVLRIVNRAEQTTDEIQRPFSQRALMEKAGQLLALREERAQPAAASS
jgi:two-component system cell cycle sensor histidine kinase/response regulator CckA